MKHISNKLYAKTTTNLFDIITHAHALGFRTDVEQLGPTKEFYGGSDITFQVTIYTVPHKEENAK